MADELAGSAEFWSLRGGQLLLVVWLFSCDGNYVESQLASFLDFHDTHQTSQRSEGLSPAK